jgi:oxygen-independent coproporphyrinogen-3 oxidase
MPGEPARGVRYRNDVLAERYMQRARTMGRGVSFSETEAHETCATSAEDLDADVLVKERIMLGLRLAEGFDVAQAEQDLATVIRTPERERAVTKMVTRERLGVDGTRWHVPKRRWLLVDGTAAELF